MQLFKTNDPTRTVFHENDFITRFFTEVFVLRIPEPYRQGVARTIVNNLYLLHI